MKTDGCTWETLEKLKWVSWSNYKIVWCVIIYECLMINYTRSFPSILVYIVIEQNWCWLLCGSIKRVDWLHLRIYFSLFNSCVLFRMDFCMSLGGSRVRTLPYLLLCMYFSAPTFPPFSIKPPPFSYLFLIRLTFLLSTLSSRANSYVRWWKDPSSTHWEQDKERDTFPRQCDSRWWPEGVSNLPHDT